MGFSPTLVGLTGERVNHPFLEPRGDCPHRGIDITSSGTHKNFCAGIFGRVVPPLHTGWGTIAVNPFHDVQAIVQFLHSSSIAVSIGEFVAPWTILGRTGDTAPPGSGVSGIHLHVQVVRPGTPAQECWDRNYVDPETWPIVSPIIAHNWHWQGTDVSCTLSINTDDAKGKIGQLAHIAIYNWSAGGKRCFAQVERTWNVIATGRDKNGILCACEFLNGRVLHQTCNYPTPITGESVTGRLLLTSATSLTSTLKGQLINWTRPAHPTPTEIIASDIPRGAVPPFGAS
jgi:hypothetical protein